MASRRVRKLAALALVAACWTATIGRAEYAADEPWMRIRPIVGEESGHLIEPGQTLHDVAFLHRLGFDAVQRLNPELDPWLPRTGTVVKLPTRFALPPAAAEGLVVNLPEMRLYDFTGNGPVRVLAVAVGDPDDPTPIGEFRIGQKREDPVWNVPASIRKERPDLPAQVPPGEDNPLGTRWMTLGRSSYGIHGTNVRWSIGRGATHGCVRLYEDTMEALFDRVGKGARVSLIYEPYKWGSNGKWRGPRAFRFPSGPFLEPVRPSASARRAARGILQTHRRRDPSSATALEGSPTSRESRPLLPDGPLERGRGLLGRIVRSHLGSPHVGLCSLRTRDRVRRRRLGCSSARCRVVETLIDRVEPRIDIRDLTARRTASKRQDSEQSRSQEPMAERRGRSDSKRRMRHF
jgi:lipoprotein-anchoring transpeptidase ErfK/SrfK